MPSFSTHSPPSLPPLPLLAPSLPGGPARSASDFGRAGFTFGLVFIPVAVGARYILHVGCFPSPRGEGGRAPQPPRWTLAFRACRPSWLHRHPFCFDLAK